MADRRSSRREITVRLTVELAIIVLGVTIALWADGLVADRRDQAVEAARLAALRDNVQRTRERLSTARDNAAGAADALRKLITLQAGDEVQDLLRYGLFYGPAFYPELNVYDDLKSSGELALLKNSTLRQSLAALDARLELVRAAQDDLTTVQQLTIDPYLVKRIDLLPLLGPLSGIDPTDEGSDVDSRFLSDVEFRNLMLFKLDLVIQTEKVFEDADAALIAVEQSMAAENPQDKS